ncbi:FadR/GntR family transcriptional regulator [Streptomyces sp. NPDC101118]|uniref:FadR/GntR family transcriptional regulator n=1 Tax=Streptomyces sp. NPDC101118 TaxID=3366109 RepID=UPI003813CA83
MSDAAYAGRGIHRTAVDGLARRIFDGSHPEGAVLELPALMTELGVSQTVLREAVKVLTAKGLLDARPKRGTFVRPAHDWNLLDADVLRWKLDAGPPDCFFADLLELRRSVEPAAAALAADRATAADFADLDAGLALMAGAGRDPDRHAEADAAFHTALLAASHNHFFVQMQRVIVPPLIERDRKVHAQTFEDPVGIHAAVVQEIRTGDPDGAYMSVLELLDVAQRYEPAAPPLGD